MENKTKRICVFASSTKKIREELYILARELGKNIALKGHTLIYGGSDRGLMGATALATLNDGGKIIEIIPEVFENVALRKGETVVTKDLSERMDKMWGKSDGYIAIPGGFGTIEEIMDVIGRNMIVTVEGKPIKPLVLVNENGFYNKLLEFFDKIYSENFAQIDFKKSYFVTTSVLEAIKYIENYKPIKISSKVEHSDKE